MFSKFEIQKKLGSGGMGAVYLAQDTELGRPVALKILPKDKADNPTLLKRFKSEAHAAANLKHDNIVMVYGAGEHEGYYYMVMEYVEGVDVHRLIAKKDQLSVKRSIEIIKQVAAALAHVSGKGIVHRDIKPSNLFIQRDGTVKLGDLGLARSIEEAEEAGVTRAGTTVGTVDYISPEQARNSKAADIRSDIYSLGCTWYHMLTGLPPFPDGSLTNKLHAHAVKPPPNPQILNEAVPDGVVAILHRMMAKRPEDRYQTPEELIEDLERSVLTKQDIANTVLASLADEEEEFIQSASITPLPASTGVSAPTPPMPGPYKPSAKTAAVEEPENERTIATTEAKTPRPMSLPANSSVRKMAIPHRVDGTVGSRDDDSFRLQVDPLKLVLMGGGTLVVVGFIIYAAILFFQGDTTDEARENRGQDANAASEDDQDATDDEGNDEEAINAVTVKGEEKQEPAKLNDSFFEQLSQDQRKHLQNVTWLKKYYLPSDRPRLDSLQVFSYANRDSTKGFPTITEAYKNAPNKGAVIEIRGNRPLDLSSLRLIPGQHIVLRGIPENDGSRPVIMVRPSDQKPLFELNDSQLVLENLHVILLPPGPIAGTLQPMFELSKGELVLRKVSISTTIPAALNVIEMTAAPGDSNRVVLEEAVVRGDRLTVLNNVGPGDEVIAAQSLLLNKSAPLIRMTKDASGSDVESPPVNLHLIASSLGSADSGMEIPSPSTGPFTVYSRENLFAALDSGANLVQSGPNILAMEPGASPSADSISMRWSEKGSCYTAWGALVQYTSDEASSIRDINAWNNLWNTAVPQSHFLHDVWLQANENLLRPVRELGAVDFLGSTVSSSGVNPQALRAPAGVDILDRYESNLVTDYANQISLEPQDPVVERFNIPEDGKKFLARLYSDEWEDNTHFYLKAKGGGGSEFDLEFSPLHVHGKSLTIEFVPSRAGESLVLRPAKASSDAGLITVDLGTVRLLNIGFDLRAVRGSSSPGSVVDVIDGNFVLEHCLLEGPFLNPAENSDVTLQSLVRWRETGTVDSEPRTGRIIDSTLSAFVPAVHCSVEKSNLQILNSCVVSGSSVVRQEILPEHENPLNSNFWSNSSLSCWDHFLDLRNQRSEPLLANSQALQMFQLYLGPPFLNRDKRPVLVQYSGSLPNRPILEWVTQGVGRDDRIRPQMIARTSTDESGGSEGVDATSQLTGVEMNFPQASGSFIEMTLKDALPEKLPRSISPLYYRLDPTVAGTDADGSPMYGAELPKLPSLTGGSQSSYNKGSNKKASDSYEPLKRRRVEF